MKAYNIDSNEVFEFIILQFSIPLQCIQTTRYSMWMYIKNLLLLLSVFCAKNYIDSEKLHNNLLIKKITFI